MGWSLPSTVRNTILVITGLGVFPPSPTPAQEIAPFRLTGVEGHVEARVLSDENEQGSTGRTLRRTATEEVFVMTHSYVYHPNLLKMDIGAGPVFVQNKLEVNANQARDSETLSNYVARLSFLENKPYPFRVFYEHLNPTVTLGLTETFIQESVRQGAGFALRQPFSPVYFTADASRTNIEGRSSTYVLDEEVDQANIQINRAFGPNHNVRLGFDVNERRSLSGNISLPIQPVEARTETGSLSTSHVLGSDRQGQLTNLMLTADQTIKVAGQEIVDRRDFQFFPSLNWRHSDKLTTFYQFSLFDSDEKTIAREQKTRTFSTGFTYAASANFTTGADLRASRNETTAFNSESREIGANAAYLRPINDWLTLSISGALRQRSQDQEATQATDHVTNEGHTIPPSLADVLLESANIVLATVNVTSVGGGQTFNVGIDFDLIVIGDRTFVRWRNNVPLPPNNQIEVDYDYLTGGTFEFEQESLNFDLTFYLFQYFSVYARYLDLDTNLVSGVPTIQLNSVTNSKIGARADYPFGTGWQVGGEVTFEQQDEDISPFDREYYFSYLQIPIGRTASAQLEARRQIINYEVSNEDLEATGYTVRWQARPWPRTFMFFEWSINEDTGGSLRRETQFTNAGFEWRIRQFFLRLDARVIDEEIGAIDTEREVLTLTARRNF